MTNKTQEQRKVFKGYMPFDGPFVIIDEGNTLEMSAFLSPPHPVIIPNIKTNKKPRTANLVLTNKYFST